MSKAKRAVDHYRQQNEMCARILAADPDRYPGLPQVWAAMVLSGVTGVTGVPGQRLGTSHPDSVFGPLFRQAA
jgi:hypothetical protein